MANQPSAGPFDEIIDRRGTDSTKWSSFDEDILPMWIADMDFLCPPAIREALKDRIEHGIFGYTVEPKDLRPRLAEYLERHYAWKVAPDAFVFLPSVVVGFNLACQAVTRPGDGVVVQPPVYYPILAAPKNARAEALHCPLSRPSSGRYEIDFDRFEATITDRTRLYMQCNPHNPVGREFSREELRRVADIALRHNLFVCSDEIHAGFVYDGRRHTPIASLGPEIEARTITLTAPSKAFNVAGLHVAVAVIPNKDLREQYVQAKRGLVPSVSALGYTAALAAYRDGDAWFAELLSYVQANRDFVVDYIRSEMPGVGVSPIEATYLAWLDCRNAGIPGDPYEFFLREAHVATIPGAIFGPQGDGFVRFNFACPRAMLIEGLERMRSAIREWRDRPTPDLVDEAAATAWHASRVAG
ncbi:MAG: PatB family C-S lyase [Candidatus Bipolaricaulota bacterium]|nr:PatB family C-S lyase [Candidatus Bipolaricaulota bacterium]